MYRRGIPALKIAALNGAAVTTVRYHLQVAAKQNPEIRTEHAAALPVKLPNPTETGLRNMQDVYPSSRPRAGCPPPEGSHRGSEAWASGNITGLFNVEEEQVDVEFIAVDVEVDLSVDEGEAGPRFSEGFRDSARERALSRSRSATSPEV